jgi:hypothetical protein
MFWHTIFAGTSFFIAVSVDPRSVNWWIATHVLELEPTVRTPVEATRPRPPRQAAISQQRLMEAVRQLAHVHNAAAPVLSSTAPTRRCDRRSGSATDLADQVEERFRCGRSQQIPNREHGLFVSARLTDLTDRERLRGPMCCVAHRFHHR